MSEKKPWYKRWWVIALFIVVGLSFLGSLFEESETPTTQAVRETGIKETQTILITKSPAEMLPVREEIPTEFKIDRTENVTLESSGFESGKKLSTYKLEGGTGLISINYIIYKFSSSDDAKSWYNKRVNKIKQEGGYEEISIPSCFAWKVDFGFYGEDGESICLKNNIVYVVGGNAAQTLRPIDGFMKNAVSLLRNEVD